MVSGTLLAMTVLSLILLAILVAVVATWLLARRRSRRLREEAERLGLRYDGRSLPELPHLMALEPLRRGRRFQPKARDVLRGIHRGHSVRWFEYEYTVSSGQTTQVVRVSVALAALPRPVPDLLVVPETWAHKVADALGAEDIDFESAEFSRRFWVKSDERRFAYDLIHPGLMEFMLGLKESRWHLQGQVLAYWIPRRVRPQEVELMLEALLGFLSRIPAHVWAPLAARA